MSIYTRIKLPPKWVVRMLSVFCWRTDHLRHLLREDMAFRRAIKNGYDAQSLAQIWVSDESTASKRYLSWVFTYFSARLFAPEMYLFLTVALALPGYLVIRLVRLVALVWAARERKWRAS